MKKKRSLAMALIMAMILCLMPPTFAGRATAAQPQPPEGDVVCRQAFKDCWKTGPEYPDKNNHDDYSYTLMITALINRRTLSADVYFEMLDRHNGTLINETDSFKRFKEDYPETYEYYKDFYEQGRVHMTCYVKDYKNDDGTGYWDYFLYNFKSIF